MGVHAPILEQDKPGLLGPLTDGHMFTTMDAAVRHIEAAT